MNASAELDALVAIKVMGWRKLSVRELTALYKGDPNPYDSGWRDPKGELGQRDSDGALHWYSAPPKYSTDIGAAWLVWEKFLTMYKYASIGVGRIAFTEPIKYHVTGENSGWCPLEICGDSAPHAICLAALKVWS